MWDRDDRWWDSDDRIGHRHISLDNRSASVTLRGNFNTVTGRNGNDTITGTHTSHDSVRLGDGADTVSLSGHRDFASLGNGTDQVTLNGRHNQLTVGSGNDTINLGSRSSFDSITVGSGHDTITTSSGAHDNSFTLDASTSSLVLNGTNNLVFINGGSDTVNDTSGAADDLFLRVGPNGGTVQISNFSTAAGVVDLAPGLGFTSTTDIANYVNTHSDGQGGSLLLFNGGSIDFHAIAPGSFSANNFRIG